MKRSLRSTFAFLVAWALCPAASAYATLALHDPPVAASRAFAVDLYRRLASKPGNLFISPWSVRTAVGMVYAGARDKTEAGIRRALHDTLGQAGFHSDAARLNSSLEGEANASESEWLAANAVWIADDLHLKPAYRDTLRRCYSAPPRSLDFAQGEASRATVNAWVEKQTRGRIDDLIPPNTLSELTRLVLCNAVYFKAAWQDTFPTRSTADASFHRRDGRAVKVPFMNAERDLRYCQSGDAQVLEIPYRGETMGLLIVLPASPEVLGVLEGRLQPDSLSAWESRLRTLPVRLAMPKFRIETGYELAGVLGAMGMRDAFTPHADFSGIARERPLFLSEVFHKAYIQVDEHGTEAAAAAAGFEQSIGIYTPRPPIVFTADHPFLFLIRSRATGAILFMGRVEDPSS